ncbi:hypothetical protein [Escherichia coli]|uniref:hypothetical protein n=1 Tax=Escherichia coli TaxID=562 RepID=UPI00345B2EFF
MGSCAAPSAKRDDKFITTDYLQQCPSINAPITATPGGTIVKATPTFDRTRADDLLLDSDA